MGDRTYTQLTYPAWADVLIAAHLGETNLGRFWGDDREVSDQVESGEVEISATTTWLGEEECNWGEHPMKTTLEALNIPFDNDWDAGGSYGAGRGFCRRMDDGQMVHEEREYNADASHMLELVDLLQESGEKAALDALKEYADALIYTARPIAYCPPTPEQRQRIIDLLCPDDEAESLVSLPEAA